jgi:hypothetical protein
MKKLMLEAQEKAKAFIDKNARPLEQRIFAYEFEGGGKNVIFDALAEFQNPDGGFGNALEPDLRLPDSSVLATTVGLQVLREYDAPADHPLVRGAMAYLLQRYDPAAQVWPIIPPNTDDAPHAPWWAYGENVAEGWGGFLVNPRVEIIGYLVDYAPPGTPAWLPEKLVAAAVAFLDGHADKVKMFDLLCYDRLVKARSLSEATCTILVEKLTPLVDALVVKDPNEWEKYGLAPLELVDSPDSAFAGLLNDAVQQHLDFEIDQQHADGFWKPKWTWGGLYPDVWEQAKHDWSGVITVRTLKILRDFGRLE